MIVAGSHSARGESARRLSVVNYLVLPVINIFNGLLFDINFIILTVICTFEKSMSIALLPFDLPFFPRVVTTKPDS